MKNKKSILEQALLQINTIEEAVQRNSEVILAATMKQELKDVLKEQAEEEEEKFSPEEEEKFTPSSEEGDDFPEDDEEDVAGGEPEDDEVSHMEPDGDEDGSFNDHDEDNEEGDEDEFGGDLDDLGSEDEDSDETLDMTGASDGEVLKVFRAMKPEDGIVVKKDGDNLGITVDDKEYLIKLTEQQEEEGLNDETVYEIELDEFDFEDDDFGSDFNVDDDDEDDLSQYGLEDLHGKYSPEEEEFDNEEEGYSDSNDVFGSDEDSFGTEELGEEVSGKDPFTKSVNSNRNQKAALGGGKKEMGKGGAIGNKDPFDKGANTSRNQKAALGGKPALAKAGKVGDTDPFDKGVSGTRKEIKEVDATAPFDKKVGKKPVQTEVGEAARTSLNPHGDKNDKDRLGIKGKRIYAAGTLQEQVESLKKQNAEYKKALLLFKDKINEVAVFNANLAHAVRIITEQTTTKEEKQNILKRFDSVSTITESKKLYGQICDELASKKPVVETVADKIASTPKTSSSTEVLSESKAYENPQFKRMKELMGKIK